jgi:hypothetical protein
MLDQIIQCFRAQDIDSTEAKKHQKLEDTA